MRTTARPGPDEYASSFAGYVARLGDDELIVLCPDADPTELAIALDAALAGSAPVAGRLTRPVPASVSPPAMAVPPDPAEEPAWPARLAVALPLGGAASPAWESAPPPSGAKGA